LVDGIVGQFEGDGNATLFTGQRVDGQAQRIADAGGGRRRRRDAVDGRRLDGRAARLHLDADRRLARLLPAQDRVALRLTVQMNPKSIKQKSINK